MKKRAIIDIRADKEMKDVGQKIYDAFLEKIIVLKIKGRLTYPDGDIIDKNLFEIRIRAQNQYRALYAYVQKDSIIILHAFIKKTKKTPKKNIKTAKRRLKLYE